ncbi:MAG: glycosyltransferase family 2 protein [Euryarchaeota archaeon]|nr:glycosyltransferase family 2 protein [Euryarchaeota archaeon]
MTAPRSDASVIVVTCNSEPWIEACLSSVFAQAPAPREVIVVDHESRDATVDIVRRKFPHATLIEAPNRGFGAGCNRGADAARGTILAFLNPDAVAEPGWLGGLAESLRERGTIATSQVVLLDDPARINTLGHGLHFTGLGFVLGYRQGRADPTMPTEVPGFSGAAFAMRREDYIGLGGFDDTFFLYQDDTELSWRARRRGFRILLVPASCARHRYSFRLDASKLYHVERGRRLILRKHLSAGDRRRLAPSLLFTSIAMRLAARRFGKAGRDAVSRAIREARTVPLPAAQAGEVPFRAFAARRLPWEAFVASRTARVAGACLNFVFRLNTLSWRRPWRRKNAGGLS